MKIAFWYCSHFVIFLFFAASWLHAQADERSWQILGSYANAPVNGYLQIPTGGEPGTSSALRPEFDELNVDSSPMYELEVRYGGSRHEFVFGSHLTRHQSTAALGLPLISQGLRFAEGDSVDLDAKTNWSELRYVFQLSEPEVFGHPLKMKLTGGSIWFDFSYQLSGITVRADRAYSKVGYTAGLEGVWSLAERFSLNGRILAPLPLTNTPRLWTAGLDAQYTLMRRDKSNLSLLAGVALSDLSYRDNQELPNRIQVEQQPSFRIGLTLSF